MQIIEDLHLAMAHSIFRIVYGRISRRTMTAFPQAEPDAKAGKDRQCKFDTPTKTLNHLLLQNENPKPSILDF